MGNKYTDILKSLTSWDIKPPAHLFKKIWQSITGKQDSQVPVYAFANFADSTNNEEYSPVELEAFRSLQNHSMIPPSFSSLKLNEIVAGKSATPLSKTATIISLKNFTRAAAAILIIACGLWFVYTKKTSVKDDNTTASVTNPSNSTSASSTLATNLTKPTNTNTPSSPALVAAVTKHNSASTEHGKKIKAFQHLNTESGGLVDNDILLTLVNYDYTDYVPLLAEIKKNNRITLGEFSYVSISDKMNDVLQKMYATKSNNKPTRKAKKLRATMEKWKKRDESHFDSNSYNNNNPIDIIDLSEFILK